MGHELAYLFYRAAAGPALRRNDLLHGLGRVQGHLQVSIAVSTAQGAAHG